jgi:predicted GIY-YIG superfamily endonuclease
MTPEAKPGVNSSGVDPAPGCVMGDRSKRTVYILRSDANPSRFYTGLTSDVSARLEWHNHGPCGVTTANRPWSLVVSFEFATERAARRFEKYLKTGSGRAFSKRHFAPADDECGI